MGLSSSSSKQTYTPSAQQLTAANTLTSAYNAQAPKTQAIADNIASLIPGLQSSIPATSSAVSGAANYYGDVLGGKYLTGNPYLTGMIDSTNNDVTDRVQSQFGTAGRTAGGANVYALSRGLADADNSLRYSDYDKQMSRMDSAASGAGALSGQTLASILGLSSTAAGLPLSQAQSYASGIGSLGIGGTQTQTSNPSTASQIGTALQIGSLLFSDRRLKHDIRRIGEYADGLGRYIYRYIWGGPMREGVLADDVARLRPWALGPRIGGFMTVDYGRL